jgi:hypothetical protein
MSYISINSAYRNRYLYPNPAEFIIPFQTINSLENNLNVLNTFNPITVFPTYSFCWTNFLSINPFIYTTTITGGYGNTIQLNFNIWDNFLGINTNIPNFYVYQNINNLSNILNNYIVSINGFSSTIIGYSAAYNQIITANSLKFVIGDTIEIFNDVKLIDPFLDYQSNFILNGLNNFTFSKSKLIYNIDINEKQEGQFNSLLNIFQTTKPFTKTVNPTDKYLLFDKTNIFIIGNIEKFINDKYYIEGFIGDFSIIEKGLNYKVNQKIYLVENVNDLLTSQNTIFKIKKVDCEGRLLEIELEEIGSQTFLNSKIYIVKIVNENHLYNARIMVNTLNTVFKFDIKNDLNLNYLPRDFFGNYFQLILLSPLYQIFENNLYLSPNFTLPINLDNSPNDKYYYQNQNGVFSINNVIFIEENKVLLFVDKIPSNLLYRFNLYQQIIDNISPIPKEYNGCLNGLIYPFIREGIVPLNFSGTYLTQSTMSCYEITVLSLIIPNLPIESLNSFLTSGVPFVILEISNYSMPSSHNKNVIYSNNPNNINGTFVCPVSDVSNPLTSNFIKINSGGMVQIIKFTPADNLKLKITLPDGNIFKTQQADYAPPSEPNPLLQFGVLLEFKKL